MKQDFIKIYKVLATVYELNGTNIFTMDFDSMYMLVIGNECYIIDSELTDKEKTQLDKILKNKAN